MNLKQINSSNAITVGSNAVKTGTEKPPKDDPAMSNPKICDIEADIPKFLERQP